MNEGVVRNMDYTCRNTIIQNMRDFGCDGETIATFMDYYEYGNINGQKKLIVNYRRKLLDELHVKQKEIDRLDYMVDQLVKRGCK